MVDEKFLSIVVIDEMPDTVEAEFKEGEKVETIKEGVVKHLEAKGFNVVVTGSSLVARLPDAITRIAIAGADFSRAMSRLGEAALKLHFGGKKVTDFKGLEMTLHNSHQDAAPRGHEHKQHGWYQKFGRKDKRKNYRR